MFNQGLNVLILLFTYIKSMFNQGFHLVPTQKKRRTEFDYNKSNLFDQDSNPILGLKPLTDSKERFLRTLPHGEGWLKSL